MAKKSKRVVIASDFHCGHKVGLTHPDFDYSRNPDKGSKRYREWYMRRAMWRFFTGEIEALKPIDVMIVNGDAIDGKGKRSGSTELLTADRTEQVDCAATIINLVGAPVTVMSYGTPYHTGELEDWEDGVLKGVKSKTKKIGGHDWISVNGLVMSYKHHLGISSIPHGRFTALAKERLWEEQWARRKEYPLAHVMFRSHVHYFDFAGTSDWLGIITPALQGYGSKYGTRKMSGTVDFGFVHFDVTDSEDYIWEPHIRRFQWLARDAILQV